MTNKKTPTPVRVNTTTATGGYIETLKSPVTGGRVTSPFGGRRSPTAGASSNHKGVDIAVPQGTLVTAAASGTVEFSGTQRGYGNVVIIKHDDDTDTKYAHLSERAVTTGQSVVGGEAIGRSGGTPGTEGAGTSTGAHLHYEVVKNGVQVNPLAQTVGIDTKKRSQNTPAQNLAQEALERKVVLNYNQDEVIQTLISGSHFKDNPADEFDNLTYHWRFFMTGDSEVAAGVTTQSDSVADFYSKLASFDQVTIAESGVTSYSIDEVTMDAVCGTDFQTESTKFTSIEMKVTEPNGVNFLDSLRNAGIQLGVRNYQKCFYYLELTFKGYNHDGTINLKPFDETVPNGGRWIWTVNISDIQVNLSAGGGSYTLSMVPMTDSLLTGTYNLIPATVTPSGDTVGAFFDNMCQQLNNIWATIKGDPGIVKYSTQFHPVKDLLTADEVRAMSVKAKEEDLNPIQGFEFKAGSPSATISQGFTISRVLDGIMSACEQAQNLAKDSVQDVSQVNDTPTSVNAKGYRQSVIWRIEPEVHTPGYDPLYNEYFHHITLHIYGFRNHSAVLSPQDTTSGEAAQKAILADMAKRNFLPKKYEYLFTGVNSEVIDLDLNFNLKWQALLPSLASNTQESAAPQARVDPKAPVRVNAISQKEQRDLAQTKQAQQIASDLANTSKDAVGLREDWLKAVEAEKTTPTDENKADTVKKKQILDAAITKARLEGRVAHETRAALTASRPASIPQNNYGRTYGEDLTNQKVDFTDQQRKEAFPITVQIFNPNDVSGTNGQYHNGKSIYGAVLNQVYGPLATQFFRIAITIKGDPFWIGAGTFEEAILRKSDIFDGGHPNYAEGANCFLFKMRYPLGQDENGDVILHTNESVTGVYQVNKITHRFVDGNFTQVLSAIRVAIVDLYDSLYKSLSPNPDPATIKKNQQTPGGNT